MSIKVIIDKGRWGSKNIVISRDSNLSIEGVDVVTSIEQALETAGSVEEVMIIGGGSIYAACLPKAHRLYVTYIDAQIEGDTQFPDWGKGWRESAQESYSSDEKNAYDMRFVVLERV